MDVWCVVMEDLFSEEKIFILRDRLKDLNLDMDIEREILERYLFCLENIRKSGVRLNGI